ncbi:MAG: ThuA domain-containing protein [Cyclobacteriaceae bacterium]|nr:ThuA domain-containing protein [Cyclobacteriaceae bacterium]
MKIYRHQKCRPWQLCFWFLAIVILSLACTSSPEKENMKIAVITKTDGYRHDNIPVAVEALKKMASENNWDLFHTEDSLYFTSANLDTLDLIIFLQTIGDIFNETQQQDIQAFVEKGGGLLTIHSGTITENDWPWYMSLIGAKFTGHPPTQKGTLIIENREHPATSFLPDSIWTIVDEWYSFDRNPREDVHVLVSIDESSYDVDNNEWFPGINQRMGDHPMVWHQYAGEGRVFQTALGHTEELYSDPLFLQHINGAIEWTAGI